MSRFVTHEFTAPACWASYLINGDASGIDDADIAEADAMVEDIGFGSPVSCSDESEFMHRADYGGLAGDMLTYSFLEDTSKEGK